MGLLAVAEIETQVGHEAEERPEGPQQQGEVGHGEGAEGGAGEGQSGAEEERVEHEVMRPGVRLRAVDEGPAAGGGGAQLGELRGMGSAMGAGGGGGSGAQLCQNIKRHC